jgi:hypothetical protein
VHTIAPYLIPLAILEGSHPANVPVGQVNFARALTETCLFLDLSSAEVLF